MKDFRLARQTKTKERQKTANLKVSHLLDNDSNSKVILLTYLLKMLGSAYFSSF